MEQLIKTIGQQLLATSTLEWLAFVLALLQVFFAIQNKAVNYLFGIASVAIYIYLFFVVKLYADASLNVYYLIVSFYGWRQWHSSNQKAISSSSIKTLTIASAIGLGSFVLSYFVLSTYTDSSVPVWDSAVAAFAWAGTWLMTQRKIENWLFLSASNAIAIPLYHVKQLEATALLTLLLLLLGLLGYFQWRKEKI